MWSNEKNFPARGFWTPPPTWKSKPSSYSPMMAPLSEKKQRSSPSAKADLFHVIHKVPTGDSPYVRAKHVQLIDRDPSKAISLFWQAINSGDRVDSALKDMAVVMKQLNRTDEAIEAIKSFRHLCPHESQESLDNVLVELYKRSGRVEEEIEMLQRKLKHIEDGIAFGGKRTKIARSQGKKIQITIDQERSRILGNLAWAYLQQNNFKTAEELYRKALFLDPDKNKQCNLAFCLMHVNRITEAKSLLQAVRASSKDGRMDESYAKSFERAFQMLTELETQPVLNPKEIRTSVNGGQDNISGFVVSRCADGNDEDSMLLNEHNRGSYCRDHFVNNDTFSRCGLQSSPQTLFVDKWKKGDYYENPLETRSDFASKRMEIWVSGTEMEVGSACKKTYASPVYVGGNPKIRLTEPRRGSRLFNRGDRSMGMWGDDAVGSSSRKLSFEQPIVENARALASVNESSKVALQKWHTGSPFPISGDWRRSSWGDPARLKNEAIAGTVEEKCFGGNNSGFHEPISGNPKPTQNLSLCKSKKSWADMVEEEEQELSSYSIQTPSKCFDGWDSGEEFNDENLNSNIIRPLNQTENLRRKFESSFDLKDGKSKSGNANSTVRRSLCFEQQQKPDPVDYFCSSPLPKKALNFEGNNCVSADERESLFGKNIKPMRRNRLQVFRDITLLPESP